MGAILDFGCPSFRPSFRHTFISAQYLEQINRISPNLICAVILTRSTLGMLHIIFCTFVPSYGPYFRPKISFPIWVNILRTNWQNFTKYYTCINYWQVLCRDCYTLVFSHLYQSYGPWFTEKFRFRSIILNIIDRISPNFIHASILTRSTLGLLHITFRIFVPELWPMIYARISFPLNILRTFNWQNFTKFCVCIHIDRI